MGLRNHGPGSPVGRRRGAFLPEGEVLEGRRLLSAAVDLATTQSSNLGVEFIGQNNFAGYTVTDVGDVTGSGFDDFVVAAPGNSTPPTTTGDPTFTGTSTAYLVFGSKEVNVTSFATTNWLQLTPGERGADLTQLGTLGTPPATAQVNPTVAQPAPPATPITGFNFDGLTFTTGTTPSSGLGFSVAALGDINGDGINDFAIGAPDEAGGGAVYIIYGGAGLASIPIASKSIDLDSAAGQSTLAGAGRGVLKIVGTALPGTPGAEGLQVGYSVAGLGNFINPGTQGLAGTAGNDVAIGVPGLNSDTGAVFALSGTRLTSLASGSTTDLSTTITTGTGIANEYVGINIGDRTGASVSSGGDFDGAKTSQGNHTVNDLLIGAPDAGSGAAYLVYGIQNTVNSILPQTSTLGQVVPLSQLSTAPNTTAPFNNPLQGLVFSGAPTSLLGFSVSSAGDFNGDGFGDIILGAPSGAGSASIYYGQGPLTNRYTGNYGASAFAPPNPVGTLLPLPLPLVFTGAPALSSGQPGDEAGFSVSYVGDIPGEGINGVLIGAPGSLNSAGEAYIVPGNYASTGTPANPNTSFPSQVTLATAITNATYAILPLTLSGSTAGGPAYLGASVSGRPPFLATQKDTVDADLIPDVFIGAPGFSFSAPNSNTPGRTNAGAGFALEGANLGVAIPDNVLLTSAGVNSNNPAGTYTLTTSGAATFDIFSAPATATLPAFNPATDLTSPITITINGVQFTNVTLTTGTDSTARADVSFVLTAAQVQSLGLVAGSSITITISGLTNSGTAFVARATNVSVTAGGGASSGGTGAGIVGPTAATILAPPIFTGINAGLPYPPVSSLEHLTSYQPLPVQLAYQQYLAQPGFLAREEVYTHPSKASGAHQAARGTVLYVPGISKSENKYSKKNTLSHTVLSKSKFTYGKSITFTHKVKVIPRSQQTETFSA